MMSRFNHLHAGCALAFCVGLAGCVSGERHGSTLDRRPAMPTVALPTAGTSQSVSESEIIARAIRAANSSDVDGVVRAFRMVGDPSQRPWLVNETMKQIAGLEASFTARLALALASEFPHVDVIENAGRKLVQQDPERALRWAAELPPGAPSRQMSRVIIDELVGRDPGATIDRIKALSSGKSRDDLLVVAAGAWARRDPDAAISWVRDVPDDELKPRLTSSVGFEVAQTRPERAIAVAEMLPEGRNRWLLFSAIAQTWVAVDSKEAMAWAGRLPAGEPRDAALAGIDTGFGVPSSRRIAGAPGTRGGSSRTRGGAGAVAAYPVVNSPSFEAWLALQPPGMSREEALLEYVRQRAALEPSAIGPLISSLPSGYTRDQATAIYLDNLLISSPREAAQWLRSLPRSERNDELIEKTARRWLLTNPDAAAEWLNRTPLPGYQKDRLLREAGR